MQSGVLDVNAYRRNGLAIPEFSLSTSELARLRDATEVVVAGFEGTHPDVILNVHLPKSAGGVSGGGAAFFALAVMPEILDLVEAAIGPDVVLWATSLFAKRAGVGAEVPWHQDAHYWPIRPLAACTVWIAVDDATSENGCMRYIPGSHRIGTLAHCLREDRSPGINDEIPADLFDEERAQDDALRAGQLSIHDVYLIHGSRPNLSGRRRAGFTIRYMPASSLFDRSVRPGQSQHLVADPYSRRPIWLVRGENRNPGNDFEVGHAGLEALDEIANAARLVASGSC